MGVSTPSTQGERVTHDNLSSVRQVRLRDLDPPDRASGFNTAQGALPVLSMGSVFASLLRLMLPVIVALGAIFCLIQLGSMLDTLLRPVADSPMTVLRHRG
jgi:hypothetical protein